MGMKGAINIGVRLLLSTRAIRSSNEYTFYDLVCQTPSHPKEPLEAAFMSEKEARQIRSQTKRTYEGNYGTGELTPEQRMLRVFGGGIKGEPPRSSSRVSRGKPKVIAGITVPDRPPEPDNCCMSGCIDCVWERYNEDMRDWRIKRRQAADALKEKGGIWPEDFRPPLRLLDQKNIPVPLRGKIQKGEDSEEDTWKGVPISIRVFVETEEKMKQKRTEKKTKVQQRETKGKAEQQAAT